MSIMVRHLGMCQYQPVWDAMRRFVDDAQLATKEELWLLQHFPVYTLGRNGKRHHLLRSSDIPLIHCDRGGEITYHAPGQIVAYLMLNIGRRRLGLRQFVRSLESAVIDLLSRYNIHACGKVRAPGVYVNNEKIAALGLRLRRGWSYHGISLNINMDLSPFSDINPCGYENLAVTQMSSLCTPTPSLRQVEDQLAALLLQNFS